MLQRMRRAKTGKRVHVQVEPSSVRATWVVSLAAGQQVLLCFFVGGGGIHINSVLFCMYLLKFSRLHRPRISKPETKVNGQFG